MSAEKDNRKFVKVGTIEIEFNDGFHMYLVSHRSNPKFSAHVYSRAVVINFNTTLLSLENQLLDIVFDAVDGELAMERASLYASVAANHKRLDELESGLLTQIALCDGNLLDNPNTMKLLESTKLEVIQFNAEIFTNENTLTNIETKRNDFRLIASKAASLYFVLADMAALNPFYQHAMCDFIDIFMQIMASIQLHDTAKCSSDSSNDRIDLNQRLLKIIGDLSKRIYNIGSMGIFQKDKLLFSLRIAMELEHYDGRLGRNEIDFLFKPINVTCASNSSSYWLTNQQYNDANELMVAFPTVFGDFLNQLIVNAEQWQMWLQAKSPESINCPEPYAQSITLFQVAITLLNIYENAKRSWKCGFSNLLEWNVFFDVNNFQFQKLLILRCFRPDRLLPTMQTYIKSTIGEEFLISPVVDFNQIFTSSMANVPILVYPTDGMDPMHQILRLSHNYHGANIISIDHTANDVCIT